MEYAISFLVLLGAFWILISAWAILRFPDLLSRLHAASKASSFGLSFVLIGVALASGAWVQAIVTIVWVYATLPVAAHMIARAAYAREKAPRHYGRDDYRTWLDDTAASREESNR